jgi:hypothetical protein
MAKTPTIKKLGGFQKPVQPSALTLGPPLNLAPVVPKPF